MIVDIDLVKNFKALLKKSQVNTQGFNMIDSILTISSISIKSTFVPNGGVSYHIINDDNFFEIYLYRTQVCLYW